MIAAAKPILKVLENGDVIVTGSGWLLILATWVMLFFIGAMAGD